MAHGVGLLLGPALFNHALLTPLYDPLPRCQISRFQRSHSGSGGWLRPQPTRRTSWQLVGNPGCELVASFQLVRLVDCGL